MAPYPGLDLVHWSAAAAALTTHGRSKDALGMHLGNSFVQWGEIRRRRGRRRQGEATQFTGQDGIISVIWNFSVEARCRRCVLFVVQEARGLGD